MAQSERPRGAVPPPQSLVWEGGRGTPTPPLCSIPWKPPPNPFELLSTNWGCKGGKGDSEPPRWTPSRGGVALGRREGPGRSSLATSTAGTGAAACDPPHTPGAMPAGGGVPGAGFQRLGQILSAVLGGRDSDLPICVWGAYYGSPRPVCQCGRVGVVSGLHPGGPSLGRSAGRSIDWSVDQLVGRSAGGSLGRAAHRQRREPPSPRPLRPQPRAAGAAVGVTPAHSPTEWEHSGWDESATAGKPCVQAGMGRKWVGGDTSLGAVPVVSGPPPGEALGAVGQG